VRYRIVCDNQMPVNEPKSHAHIVELGTGDSGGYTRRWRLAEVIAAIGQGDTFYTLSSSTGRDASVQAVNCPVCGHMIIRSSADAVTDNNLDKLPDCAC